jgi:hypothetical protein
VKGSGPSRIWGICVRRSWAESQQISVDIVSVPAEIWTWCSPNTSYNRQSLSQLAHIYLSINNYPDRGFLYLLRANSGTGT